MKVELTIPNLLTLLRLLLTPLFILAYFVSDYTAAWTLFLIAGLSDALDGFLARILNQQSISGAVLDPIADKVLLITSFVCLAWRSCLPIWMAALFVSRDIMIVGGLLYLKSKGRPVENEINPLLSSKFTTLFQLLLIFIVLTQLSFGVDFYVTQLLVEFVAVAFTIFSGIIYMRIGWGMVKN